MNRQDDTRAQTTLPNRDPLAIPAICPEFYAFGAAYPDGTCHDGHICDADYDYCTEELKGHIPCPSCRNDAYQAYLADGSDLMYPYGFDVAHPGDYFMPRIGIEAWQRARHDNYGEVVA